MLCRVFKAEWLSMDTLNKHSLLVNTPFNFILRTYLFCHMFIYKTKVCGICSKSKLPQEGNIQQCPGLRKQFKQCTLQFFCFRLYFAPRCIILFRICFGCLWQQRLAVDNTAGKQQVWRFMKYIYVKKGDPKPRHLFLKQTNKKTTTWQ